jgi:hypothetical protein
MSAIRGGQVKYYEVYIGTLRSILRRTTKKCAIYAGPAIVALGVSTSRRRIGPCG